MSTKLPKKELFWATCFGNPDERDFVQQSFRRGWVFPTHKSSEYFFKCRMRENRCRSQHVSILNATTSLAARIEPLIYRQ